MTKEQIKTKMQAILDKNAHWEKCQDGSYEMALSCDGYWELKRKLDELEKNDG